MGKRRSSIFKRKWKRIPAFKGYPERHICYFEGRQVFKIWWMPSFGCQWRVKIRPAVSMFPELYRSLPESMYFHNVREAKEYCNKHMDEYLAVKVVDF